MCLAFLLPARRAAPGAGFALDESERRITRLRPLLARWARARQAPRLPCPAPAPFFSVFSGSARSEAHRQPPGNGALRDAGFIGPGSQNPPDTPHLFFLLLVGQFRVARRRSRHRCLQLRRRRAVALFFRIGVIICSAGQFSKLPSKPLPA